MTQITAAKFFELLKASGKSASRADRLDGNGYEYWDLKGGKTVARDVGLHLTTYWFE